MHEQTTWKIYDAKKWYTTKIERPPIQISQIMEIITFLKDDTTGKGPIQIDGLKSISPHPSARRLSSR